MMAIILQNQNDWNVKNKPPTKQLSSLSRIRLSVTPWTVADQTPLSMGFSRQEYWSGLPFPSSGDLPHPGIEARSPALQADALPSKPPGIKLVSPPNLKSLGSKPKDLINHRLGVFRKFQKQTRICHKLATIYTWCTLYLQLFT